MKYVGLIDIMHPAILHGIGVRKQYTVMWNISDSVRVSKVDGAEIQIKNIS